MGEKGGFPEPLGMVDVTRMGDATAGISEYLYMLSDALGSVVALADDDGEIVERYHYSPYGVTPLLQPNVNSNGLVIGYSLVPSRYGNPFLWTSQRIDPNTGLYNFLARTYDPYRGRWLQRDPMGPLGLGGGEPAYGLGTPSAFGPTLSAGGEYGDSFSLYQYSRFNPIRFIDPRGRQYTYAGQMMNQGLAAGLLGMMGATAGIGLTASQYGYGVTGLDAISFDTFMEATEAFMDGRFAAAETMYSLAWAGTGISTLVVAASLDDLYDGLTVAEIIRSYRKGSIMSTPLPPGGPGWDEILEKLWEEIVEAAKQKKKWAKTVKKLLTDGRFAK